MAFSLSLPPQTVSLLQHGPLHVLQSFRKKIFPSVGSSHGCREYLLQCYEAPLLLFPLSSPTLLFLLLFLTLFLFLPPSLCPVGFLALSYICFPRGAPLVVDGSTVSCGGSVGDGWNQQPPASPHRGHHFSPTPLPAPGHLYPTEMLRKKLNFIVLQIML